MFNVYTARTQTLQDDFASSHLDVYRCFRVNYILFVVSVTYLGCDALLYTVEFRK